MEFINRNVTTATWGVSPKGSKIALQVRSLRDFLSPLLLLPDETDGVAPTEAGCWLMFFPLVWAFLTTACFLLLERIKYGRSLIKTHSFSWSPFVFASFFLFLALILLF